MVSVRIKVRAKVRVTVVIQRDHARSVALFQH